MWLRDQESCVINGCTIAKYFSFARGSCQCDPMSAFLFNLAVEVFFPLTKSKLEIEGMKIFDYNYLYSVNADDTTFFLKDITCIKHMVHTFLLFFGLKLNLTKSETAGIRVLKEVHVAVCSMRCLDLNNNAIKVLGIPFRYNEKLKDEI